jgi:hypothetical protein
VDYWGRASTAEPVTDDAFAESGLTGVKSSGWRRSPACGRRLRVDPHEHGSLLGPWLTTFSGKGVFTGRSGAVLEVQVLLAFLVGEGAVDLVLGDVDEVVQVERPDAHGPVQSH